MGQVDRLVFSSFVLGFIKDGNENDWGKRRCLGVTGEEREMAVDEW